jgi:hypothetical protein
MRLKILLTITTPSYLALHLLRTSSDLMKQLRQFAIKLPVIRLAYQFFRRGRPEGPTNPRKPDNSTRREPSIFETVGNNTGNIGRGRGRRHARGRRSQTPKRSSSTQLSSRAASQSTMQSNQSTQEQVEVNSSGQSQNTTTYGQQYSTSFKRSEGFALSGRLC